MDFFNKKIEYLTKKPIVIFKIKNFLPSDFYDEIHSEFVSISKYIDNDMGYEKKQFDSEHPKYNEIISKNKNLLKLDKIINSENFFKSFYKKNLPLILKSRITQMDWYSWPYFVKNFIFKNAIKTKIQFSEIKNNGKINIHTDSNKKLVSLMLYFPDNKLNIKEKEIEKNLGTIFYSSRLSQKDNKHLKTEKDIKEFNLNSNKILTTIFEKNTLYGFLKSKKSFHSVNKININDKYIRRSINININFK